MHRSVHIFERKEPVVHGVRIDLDKVDASYAPGDDIRGRVVVQAKHDQAYESLTLELQLHVQGKIQGALVLAEEQLSTEHWRAGEEHSYPFSVPAPRCPANYRGERFSVSPRLAAVLVPIAETEKKNAALGLLVGDVSMETMRARAHPEAVLPIHIAPDTRPLAVHLDPGVVNSRGKSRGIDFVIGTILLAVGLVLGGVTLLLYSAGHQWTTLLATGVPGGLLGAIGLMIVIAILPDRMAERRVGLPELAAQTRDGPDGQVLEISVRLAPTAKIRGAKAALGVRELATVEVSADTDNHGVRTKEHTLMERPLELTAGDQPGLFVGQIPMSEFEGLPQVLDLPAGKVRWRLRVAVQIPWWPDWEAGYNLHAFPGGESRSMGRPVSLTFE